MTTAPPTTPCPYSDTFTGSDYSYPSATWTLAKSGKGNYPYIYNNKLRVSNATKKGESIAELIQTHSGDFDVRVKIWKSSGSSSANVRWQLRARIDSQHLMAVAMGQQGGLNRWYAGYKDGSAVMHWDYELVRTNTFGWLRLVRLGGIFYAYITDGTSTTWQTVCPGYSLGIGDVTFNLRQDVDNNYACVGDFDDFIEEICFTTPPTTLPSTTEAPTTIAPTTLAPTTISPSTLAPSTLAPTTGAPSSTSPPTTLEPTTLLPTTPEPTIPPTTPGQTTLAPSTKPPTSPAPTTLEPSTLAPTTLAATTLASSTLAPTTQEPSTQAPTTLAPSTLAPSTLAATTAEPTTVAPSTLAPTTLSPITFGPYTDYDSNFVTNPALNVRFIINAGELSVSGNLIQVKMAYYDSTWAFDRCFIGHQAAVGDLYDFDGGQKEVTFDGGSHGATVGVGGKVSDTIFFQLDETKNLILSFYFSNYAAIPKKLGTTGYDMWHKIGSDEAQKTDVTGYTRALDYYLRKFIEYISAETALTTPAPTTIIPTTVGATTAPPTTSPPKIVQDVIVDWFGLVPTSLVPTTPLGTIAPTTPEPGFTIAPTTPAPPTTLLPTTLAPTTVVPTTEGPYACTHTEYSLIDESSVTGLITDEVELYSLIADEITVLSRIC